MKGPHYAAFILDVILGLALLALGILSTHYHFFSLSYEYAFIGAGAAYTFGLLCNISRMIKTYCTDDCFLIGTTRKGVQFNVPDQATENH